MRRILLTFIVCALMATPVMAVPTISFSQSTGSFSYNPNTQIFTFNPIIDITHGVGNPLDALADDSLYAGTAPHIVIPDLLYSGGTVAPSASTTIYITDGTLVYFSGTLGIGNLIDGGSGVLLYTATINEINAISVPNQTTPASLALSQIMNHIAAGGTSADLVLSITDASVDSILTQGSTNGDVSGSISIPAPGAILLGSLGAGLVGWLRRRKSL